MKRPAIEAYRVPGYWALALVAMRLGVVWKKKRKPAKEPDLQMRIASEDK